MGDTLAHDNISLVIFWELYTLLPCTVFRLPIIPVVIVAGTFAGLVIAQLRLAEVDIGHMRPAIANFGTLKPVSHATGALELAHQRSPLRYSAHMSVQYW